MGCVHVTARKISKSSAERNLCGAFLFWGWCLSPSERNQLFNFIRMREGLLKKRENKKMVLSEEESWQMVFCFQKIIGGNIDENQKR
jgi:hypothetical protein